MDSKVAVPQHVVHRAFPAETVLLNLQSGQYHGLNPTAGRMFEVLSETDTPRGAVSRLAEEFQQQPEVVEADLNELCRGLADRGLLKISSS